MASSKTERLLARTLLCGLPLLSTLAPSTAAQKVRGVTAEEAQELEEPAVVNAPVAPDAIYVGRVGQRAGLSVIDLNGFGQSTGNPEFDFLDIQEGDSKFLYNPNVSLQGSLLIPPLAVGFTTIDGGSSGVFTLTRSSELSDLLVARPVVSRPGDMMLGQPLDLVFNNALPFGCQSGGGNICATTGLRIISLTFAPPHQLFPTPPGFAPDQLLVGTGNPISFAPHPNPPGVLPGFPLCVDPLIPAQEPTSVDAVAVLGLTNLLIPGDPLGRPEFGMPPSGLLSAVQNAYFAGPSPPQTNIALCGFHQVRQQVGHFLYVVDRARGEVLVLNSNTFAVIDSVSVEDPVELAMGPNVDFLAVTSRATDSVHFIDIQPSSSTFHQVVKITDVGHRPAGIAWDPGNEDILVCNEGDDSLSVVSAFTFEVRKEVTGGMQRPFAVAITPRQDAFGHFRSVYFGYALDRNGRVSLFESGPDGVNGWGQDTIVGRTPFAFRHATAIQPDPRRLTSGVWITHQGQLAEDGSLTGLPGGAVSELVLDSDATGIQPLVPGAPPDLRGLSFRVAASIGSDQLTGTPRDLAFDDQNNLGALSNYANAFSAGFPAATNGKNLVRFVASTGMVNTNEPQFLFVAVRGAEPGDEAIDVIQLSSGLRVDTNAFQTGVQSIDAPGAAIVMSYFRQ